MKRRTLFLGSLFTLCLLGFGVTWAVASWKAGVRLRQDEQRFLTARKAIELGGWERALDLYRESERLGFPQPERIADWLDLRLAALVDLRKGAQLAALYQAQPEVIEAHEEASLLLIAWLLANDRTEASQALRDGWRGREVKGVEWLFLDAECLVKQGDPAAAISLLESTSLAGEADARRLLRLAFLEQDRESRRARLNDALQQHPLDADVRRARARYLLGEGADRLAAYEYSVALGLEPSPALCEEASRFFLRQGNAAAALSIWQRVQDSDAVARLHATMWETLVGHPASVTNRAEVLSADAPEVGEHEFWNHRLATAVNGYLSITTIENESLCLRFLETVRQGELGKAAKLLDRLEGGRFAEVPGLRELLRNVLVLKQALNSRDAVMPTLTLVPGGSHPLIQGWNAAIDRRHQARADQATFGGSRLEDASDLLASFEPPFARLLATDEIWSAILLAAGLPEAGLRMSPGIKEPPMVPDWFLADYAAAISLNRRADVAWGMIRNFPATPEVINHQASVLLALRRTEEAVALLETLRTRESEAGKFAARLQSVALVQAGDLERAESILLENAALRESIPGTELAMRIAIQRGDLMSAETLAQQIAGRSGNALQFLMLRALAVRDIERAGRIARDLVARYPDRPDYRNALQKVLALEEGRGA